MGKVSPFILAYGILAVFVVGVAAVALTMTTRSTPPMTPIEAFRPCRQIVGGPTRVYVCANGRVYSLAGQTWTDVGRATPVPGVPK